MTATLEHANYTVTNPETTAAWMRELFGWHVRWSGDAMAGGHTVHVGTDTHYVALYTPGTPKPAEENSYSTVGRLNHIAVTVPDIDEMEAAVKAAGFTPENHGDYEPGRRFYFHDHDGIEYEIVSYS